MLISSPPNEFRHAFFNNTISPYRYFYIFILQMFWGQTSSMQTFHICLWECKLVLLASSCVNRAEKCVGGVLTIRAICHFFALWRGRSLFWISGRTLFVSSYSKMLRPYIWCHKIIMNVIFKSICWLQQRIRDTLCSWIQLRCLTSVCECVRWCAKTSSQPFGLARNGNNCTVCFTHRETNFDIIGYNTKQLSVSNGFSALENNQRKREREEKETGFALFSSPSAV